MLDRPAMLWARTGGRGTGRAVTELLGMDWRACCCGVCLVELISVRIFRAERPTEGTERREKRYPINVSVGSRLELHLHLGINVETTGGAYENISNC